MRLSPSEPAAEEVRRGTRRACFSRAPSSDLGLCVLASDWPFLTSKELTSSRYGIAMAAFILAARSPRRRATFPERLQRVGSRVCPSARDTGRGPKARDAGAGPRGRPGDPRPLRAVVLPALKPRASEEGRSETSLPPGGRAVAERRRDRFGPRLCLPERLVALPVPSWRESGCARGARAACSFFWFCIRIFLALR